MAAKKVYKKKATAKKARKKGQPIYKVKAGWKVGKKRKKTTRRR